MRPTPPQIPHVRPTSDSTADAHEDDEEEVPPTQLSYDEHHPSEESTTASTQAGDTDAALTQDTAAAEAMDELGTSTQLLYLGETEAGNTADTDATGPAEVDDVVQPNTADTDRADDADGVDAVGVVHVEVPTGGSADAEAEAVTQGDHNLLVQNVADAEVNTDAEVTGVTRGVDVKQINGGAGGATPTALTADDNAERYTPQHWTAAELRRDDPLMQDTTPADQKLIGIYGDTIHQNDGRHLDGGIGVANDQKWQRLHMRIAACQLSLYDVPARRWSARFLTIQTTFAAGRTITLVQLRETSCLCRLHTTQGERC